MLLSILLFLATLLPACTQNLATKTVRLGDLEDAALTPIAANGQPKLRVALGSVISPKGTVASYGGLVAYVGRRMGMPGELVQRATYAETNELVRRGEVELALVCSGAYVDGQRDSAMELLAAPQVAGQTVYFSYIIVPKNSPVQTVEQLRGKVFAFTDPLSNSGRLSAVYLLYQMNERPETFFQKTIYTYSHDNSLKAVADGLVDGAAVDSLVYDYALAREPQYAERVRVIRRSPPYGMPPVVVPAGLDPAQKAQLQSILLNMHEDPEGRAILNDLMIDRFVPVTDSAYDSIRDMVSAVGQKR
ncbi:MAG: phosphate/phosphite/phosphonate ABC transporter substrate-binding protein [Chloroflexota bacterium]|nr:phosphate/phosphite/phosphonate ABC transporter substrate-binding protein [Chloroflexota bacterium]